MDRMNPLDCTFLYLEDGITHMHIASVAIFEGPAPPYERVVALFAAKLPLIPRYRQKVRFVPFQLGRPVWVDDPHFRLEYHVRHTALPRPGGDDELRHLVGRVMSQELDRHRPLWEAWVVEGLQGGRWAILSKVHHCMVDGISGIDLMSVVLDASPEPPPAVVDAWRPRPEPSPLQLVVDAVADLVRDPFLGARAVAGALTRPRDTVVAVARVLGGVGSTLGHLRATPDTSVDGDIGPHRRWDWTTVSIDDVRTIRHALGGTLNDVVLAAIAGGFRALVVARGEDPAQVRLHSLVPVSVRPQERRGELNNLVSAVYLELPLAAADPVERLEAVRHQMYVLKSSHQADAGQALLSLAERAPHPPFAALLAGGTRLYRRRAQRHLNTVTTNVPGPRQPLYACGRRMVTYLPYVPIGQGLRIGVAILSYEGTLGIGVTGDYDAAPDIRVLCEGVDDAVAGMLERAAARTGTPA